MTRPLELWASPTTPRLSSPTWSSLRSTSSRARALSPARPSPQSSRSKASAETYSPVGGKVSEINKAFAEKPETLNSDPYGAAWMIKVEGGGPGADLMDAAAYEKYCAERTH